MIGIQRLQRFLLENEGNASVEIISSLGNSCWYIDLELRDIDQYIAFGDYYDNLEQGLQESLNALEFRTGVRRGFN